jgi:hypothetical protein
MSYSNFCDECAYKYSWGEHHWLVDRLEQDKLGELKPAEVGEGWALPHRFVFSRHRPAWAPVESVWVHRDRGVLGVKINHIQHQVPNVCICGEALPGFESETELEEGEVQVGIRVHTSEEEVESSYEPDFIPVAGEDPDAEVVEVVRKRRRHM